MIDCSTNQEEKDLFITNFEIQEDSILVHYANGKTESIKKTKENNEKLMTKMKSQIFGLEEYCENKKFGAISNGINIALLSIVFAGFACITIGAIVNFISAGLIDVGSVLLTSLFGVGSVITFKTVIEAFKLTKIMHKKYKSGKIELEKFKMYLSNQKTLEEHIIYDDIIKEVKISEQEVKSRSLDGNANINLIDSMKLEDLKKLVLYLNKLENQSLERFEPENPEVGHQKAIGQRKMYSLKDLDKKIEF